MRLTRDAALFVTALGLATYDVIFRGGSPEVLTFCTSLLLLPGVLRYDERRRNGHDR